MKFTFKIQKYQTDAVDALVKCFEGQQFADKVQYLRDKGIMPQVQKTGMEQGELFENELLENIHKIQDANFIIRTNEVKRTAGDK